MPHPLAFPSHVPLVGQPIKVLGYTAVVSVQCQCGAAVSMQLMVQANEYGLAGIPAGCGACRTVYQVQGAQAGPDGSIVFALAMQRPPTEN